LLAYDSPIHRRRRRHRSRHVSLRRERQPHHPCDRPVGPRDPFVYPVRDEHIPRRGSRSRQRLEQAGIQAIYLSKSSCDAIICDRFGRIISPRSRYLETWKAALIRMNPSSFFAHSGQFGTADFRDWQLLAELLRQVGTLASKRASAVRHDLAGVAEFAGLLHDFGKLAAVADCPPLTNPSPFLPTLRDAFSADLDTRVSTVASTCGERFPLPADPQPSDSQAYSPTGGGNTLGVLTLRTKPSFRQGPHPDYPFGPAGIVRNALSEMRFRKNNSLRGQNHGCGVWNPSDFGN
jgi:hypothetical protein